MASMIKYPGPGCIVEFLQGNTPQIAWVLEEQSGRLRLILPNRREQPLQAQRLLPWHGPNYAGEKSRDAIINLLNEHREKREKLAKEMDVLELWGLTQGEVDKATVSWLAELALPQADADSLAACGRALLECKSHFRFQPPEFEIFSQDVVDQRIHAEESQRQREALVGGGAEWFRQLWEARINRRGTPSLDLAPPEPVLSRLKRMLLQRIADPESQEDITLWKQVSKGLPDEVLLPLMLAMTWGLVPEHHNYWLDRAGYSAGNAWAEQFQDEVAALLAKRDELASKVPLSQESFISIDSPSTRDIDDAFSIAQNNDGTWNIKVALACPALAWPFSSPLDKAVSQRATSIYLPEGDSHMMPEALGVDGYSLWAGQVRPALVVKCHVDADGSTLSVQPEFLWVNLTDNLHYQDCEAVLEGHAKPDNPALPHKESLMQALALAQARIDWRVRQGAVIIDRPDTLIQVEGQGADIKVSMESYPSTPKAQLLVSESMILINAAIAQWAATNNLALLHRTQDLALPKEMAGIWSTPEDVAKVVRSMAAACLETQAKPHAGMGLSAYAPMTSPLRRYPDLINEAQVLHMLSQGSPRWSLEELQSLLPILSISLDGAGMVQRARPRYWKLLYLQQQSKLLGDACWWNAVVTEENDAFVFISLPLEQIQIRGKRSMFGEKVFPGQQVKVRLGKIHPLFNEIMILGVAEAE